MPQITIPSAPANTDLPDRREFMKAAAEWTFALVGASSIGAAAETFLPGPKSKDIGTQHCPHFAGALEVFATYDVTRQGACKDLQIIFNEPGRFSLQFVTTSGDGPPRTVDFTVERTASGELSYSKSLSRGIAENATAEELTDFLSSLHGLRQYSTTINLEYRSPEGKTQHEVQHF